MNTFFKGPSGLDLELVEVLQGGALGLDLGGGFHEERIGFSWSFGICLRASEFRGFKAFVWCEFSSNLGVEKVYVKSSPDSLMEEPIYRLWE
ncbi:hypothetical protein ACFX1T_035533 [Malus domestica]